MTVDVVTIKLHRHKVARLSAALDCYAYVAEDLGDEIEARQARHDRDVIRQWLLDAYGIEDENAR